MHSANGPWPFGLDDFSVLPDMGKHPNNNVQSGHAASGQVQPSVKQAVGLHRQGKLAEAEALYQAVLQQQPANFDAVHMLGVICIQKGNFQAAVEFISKAITLKPGHASAQSNLGNALNELGRPDEALAACERALALQPDHVEALANRGNALRKLRRPGEALASYERAVSLRPGYAEAHYNRGIVLRELGRFDEALAAYERARALGMDSAEIHYNCGNALRELDRPDEALAAYQRTIERRADYAEAQFNRAVTLQKIGRLEEALAAYEQALAIRPDHAEAHYNRGNVLLKRKDPDGAIASYDRALALEPAHAEAWCNRAVALLERNRPEEGLASSERALALAPDYVEAHINRGCALRELQRAEEAFAAFERALSIAPHAAGAVSNQGLVMKDLGRPQEALAFYERAQALKPDYADAHWNESLCRLLLGDFAGGWPKYEWRWASDKSNTYQRNFPQPLWLGKEALQGKTILIHAEQGLGDTLQFCRYAKKLAALGARVILEVQPALKALLGALEGARQVTGRGEALPAFDYQTPLLSLPLAFDTRLDTIPADVPYLHADPARVEVWRSLLGARTRPRIGIVWSGNKAHANDRKRSIPFSHFSALLDAGAQFVSLQKEVTAADAAVLAQRGGILDVSARLESFADTAALIELLDLVITVDTSVAHLAGAMGKPTLVLLAFAPDWRWLLDRDDSPWYPKSMTLVRQERPGDWTDVLRRVRKRLDGLPPAAAG
ncbi:MAG: tetratricopeptide repeat protein [Sulfuritalea sp.]|nr:tetratricopeptide repeat protein [Sulfuritalea sp.]MDP1982890.1 tetratricopeptide repeat protein [Sulfuritalea sp.]